MDQKIPGLIPGSAVKLLYIRELIYGMERPRSEDGQKQMDTQAYHVEPQRRQKERGTTTDEIG